jgi:hypothetical protein
VFPITPTTGRFISWFSLTHPQILKRILQSRKGFLEDRARRGPRPNLSAYNSALFPLSRIRFRTLVVRIKGGPEQQDIPLLPDDPAIVITGLDEPAPRISVHLPGQVTTPHLT